MERPLHSVGQEGTRAHPVGKDTGEAPGSGQAGTRLRLPRPRAGQAFLGVSRAASPQEVGAPRAAPRDPVSPGQTQRHRVQRTAKASILALTESQPAGTVLRKQQRPDLQVPPPQTPADPRSPDLPGSLHRSRASHRGRPPGPDSVCKQTGHVALAARSPPPAPRDPTPDPASAMRAEGAARSSKAGPKGPRDRSPGPGTRRPR